MALTPEQARVELERRRRARERTAAQQTVQGAAPLQEPATSPQGTPTAQEAMSTAGTGGASELEYQQLDLGSKTPEEARRLAQVSEYQRSQARGPITVGRAALPQSVNKIMRERGMGFNERADALIGKAAADIGHGIKQLTVGLDPQDVADVEAWRALSEGASMDEGEGVIGAGTVGDIAGAVGAFAVPVGAAEQGLVRAGQAVRALPKWASKVGAASAVGAGEAGLMPVLEGESRGQRMAVGAALPGVLSAVGQTARKVATHPFDLSRTGETLVEEGIQPTLGQAVETGGFRPFARLAKNIEENLEGILPGIAGGRQRAEQEVVNTIAKRAVPPGALAPDSVPGTSEYFKDVDTLFDNAYSDVLDTIPDRIDTTRIAESITRALESQGMMVNPSTKRSMGRVLYGILEPHAAAGMNPRNARKFQQRIRKQISKFASVENANENTAGAVEILSAINDDISDLFEEKLGRAGAAQLRAIDQAYANKMLIETAAGYRRTTEHIPVGNLDRALRARTGRGRRLRGEGLGQDIIEPAFQAMGGPKLPRWARALSGVGVAVGGYVAPGLAAVPLATTLIGSRRAGSEMLFGLGQRQQRIRRYMQDVVEPKIGTATALVTDRED